MSIFLSASAIRDFISCSQKVLYRRTKPFPELKSKGMIIGEIAHLAIEKAWDNRDSAYRIIGEQSKRYGLSKADKINLEFCMDMFFLNFRGLLEKDDLIEHNFKVNLHDDVFLVGRMDRISRGNLFDWKSGGKVPSRLSNDIQCIIYEFAYKRDFGKEPASICVASLQKGELIPYHRDEMYVREVFDKIIPRMIRTIKNNSFDKQGMFNHSCYQCPWKVGCLGRGSGEEEYVLDSGVTPE